MTKPMNKKEIVLSMIRQLRWTHLLATIPIENPVKLHISIERAKNRLAQMEMNENE